MRDEETLLLLGLGALVLLTKRERPVVPASAWDDGWVWPVPPMRPWQGGPVYDPVISHEFEDPEHLGVDIMYRRKSPRDLLTAYRPGTPDGNSKFFAPQRTPILAARAGRIWSVEKTARGWAIVLDHSRPFATFYQHLETPGFDEHKYGLNVQTGQPTHVTVGQPLGFMGWDPLDAERLRHLHFAVWYQGSGDDASVDLAAVMAKWPRVPWAFTP